MKVNFLKRLTRKKDPEESLRLLNTLRNEKKLSKSLTLKDLTSFGIAAIIGAGIFGTIGNASAAGGPAVSILFIITAITCLFSALCYAEFASGIPLAGSAYTYAYVAFGEFVAWIIGWDLIMEYAIGNIAVAISWSDYFTNLMKGLGLNIPYWLSMDFLSASRGYDEASSLLNSGVAWEALLTSQQSAFIAWEQAPRIADIPFIADFPALMIVILITALVYRGIKETKRAANFMVIFKVLVIVMVIMVGAFYVNPGNWSPFAPEGFKGVLSGVSAVFFAYIGFDAISTTAEETKNPQKDLPLSMILSLVICTVLYVAVALILTGMVNYADLAVGDPLAYAFERAGLSFLSGIIALSAIIAMTGVLLVFQLGQPRIWMSMSRDGLLPTLFAKIHPKFHTPSFATIMTGFIVAIPALFMNLEEVTDLTSIGTLFAFAVVCGGILFRNAKPKEGQFKIPYYNSKIYLPLILLIGFGIVLFTDNFTSLLNHFWFSHDWAGRFPYLIFILVASYISAWSILNNKTLIPVLGLLSNLYLMSELGFTNWMRFILWLLIGLVVYFLYGYRKSKLNL